MVVAQAGPPTKALGDFHHFSLSRVRVNTDRVTIREWERGHPTQRPRGSDATLPPHIPALVLPDRPHQGPSIEICGGGWSPSGLANSSRLKASSLRPYCNDGSMDAFFLRLLLFLQRRPNAITLGIKNGQASYAKLEKAEK